MVGQIDIKVYNIHMKSKFIDPQRITSYEINHEKLEIKFNFDNYSRETGQIIKFNNKSELNAFVKNLSKTLASFIKCND